MGLFHGNDGGGVRRIRQNRRFDAIGLCESSNFRMPESWTKVNLGTDLMRPDYRTGPPMGAVGPSHSRNRP